MSQLLLHFMSYRAILTFKRELRCINPYHDSKRVLPLLPLLSTPNWTTVTLCSTTSWQVNWLVHIGNSYSEYISSSSSSCSVPLQERCRFHDFTPQFTIICSVPGRPQTQVLLLQVVFYCTQPRLSRTTARSSPVLRQVVDASVEGPLVVLI